MALKRQRANPSAIRAQIDAIENPTGGPPAAGPMRRLLTCVLANMLTVVLLSVSFAPHDAWWLAYVALVPWALALEGTREGWRAIGRRTTDVFKRNQPAGLLLKLATAIVRVIVPAALPFILAGMRTSLAVALVVTVIAEMLAGQQGVGYYLISMEYALRAPDMYGSIVVLTLAAYALNRLFLWWESRVIGWSRLREAEPGR